MQDRAALVRKFITELPYSRALGLELVEVSPARVILAMPWAPDLVGDLATGVVHGGAVTALMDTVSGAAVMSHPQGGLSAATLDLRLDYMRAAAAGDAIRAEAHCSHVTRSVAFVRATAWDGDTDRPVATSAAAFTVEGGP